MKLIICDCGGTLRPAWLNNYDLTVELGLPAVAKRLRGFRCSHCKWESIDGKTFDLMAAAVAGLTLDAHERLSADQLRYLRTYLGLTQKELGARMGIARKTVNEWETKAPITPQNDHILRTLVYAHLADVFRPAIQVLDHVRTAAPKGRRPPLVVGKIDQAA